VLNELFCCIYSFYLINCSVFRELVGLDRTKTHLRERMETYFLKVFATQIFVFSKFRGSNSYIFRCVFIRFVHVISVHLSRSDKKPLRYVFVKTIFQLVSPSILIDFKDSF